MTLKKLVDGNILDLFLIRGSFCRKFSRNFSKVETNIFSGGINTFFSRFSINFEIEVDKGSTKIISSGFILSGDLVGALT